MKLTATLLLILGLMSASVPAAMYRWVDDDGNVIYSQTPPPDGRQARTIAPPPRPAIPPEQARKQLDERLQKLKQIDEERKKGKEQAMREAEQARKKAEICQRARKNLELLRNRPSNTLYKVGDEYRRFTPKERAAKIEEMEKAIRQTCNP